MDRKTGIELDEYEPKLSDRDVIRSAISQGTLNFAPIHLARYITTLANGGTLYNLHIVDSVKTYDGNLVLKKEPEILEKSEFDPKNFRQFIKGCRKLPMETKEQLEQYLEIFQLKCRKNRKCTGTTKSGNMHGLWVAPYDDPQIAVVVAILSGILPIILQRYSEILGVFRDQ